jgi:flagellar hook assembly protein FlgD
MNKILILAFLLVSSLITKAAQMDSVIVDSKNKKVQIGSYVLAKDSTPSSIINYFGKPSRIETSALGVERTYAYDEMGLSFAIDPSGKAIEAIIINYNWDGDKKAAKSAYKGKLKMDTYAITELSSSIDINNNTNVKNIVCIGEIMCMTPPGKSDLVVLIGYQDKKMTQIGFGFAN